MVLLGEQNTILIDCGTNPVVRLHQAGLNPLSITDLIITHFHPDHVSGLAMFLMDSWLLGRKESLNIYGLDTTIEKARQMMALFEWHMWPGFYAVNFIPVSASTRALVLQTGEFRIFASPVEHMIPNIGLRVEFPGSGQVLAYSCDTKPSPAVIDLADQADWLIHEATGEALGHTSAEQAGEIARQAGVKKLYLVHYQTWGFEASGLVPEAQRQFSGPVELARDFAQIDI
jgi:ribonuclease Z